MAWLQWKKILKTLFVATLSTVHSKKLTVRTFRNMGLTLETLLNSKRHDHELNVNNDVDLMKKSDLAVAWCDLGQDMLGCMKWLVPVWDREGCKSTATMDDLEIPIKIKVVGQIIIWNAIFYNGVLGLNKRYVALDVDARDQRLTRRQYVLELHLLLSVLLHHLLSKDQFLEWTGSLTTYMVNTINAASVHSQVLVGFTWTWEWKKFGKCRIITLYQ